MALKKHKWVCPGCNAPAHGHGKGGTEKCKQRSGSCEGLICECEGESSKLHGLVADDPCPDARCYHCEWSGQMPSTAATAEETKSWPSWAKAALKAGWSPPKNWSP